jgi:hypothetical protein
MNEVILMKLRKSNNLETKNQSMKELGRTRLDRMLAGAVLAAGLMLTGPKPAKANTVEVMAGNKNTTMDLKASADVTDKLNVLIRARPSIDYTGAISSFALLDLNIKLVGGLDAIGEVQAFDGKVVPRFGAQYFTKKGDFSLYDAATIGLDAKPYLESDTVLRYVPVLHNDLKLLTQFENLSDVDKGGNIFSTQRIRLGLEWKGWGVGAAADLTELGHNPSSKDGTLSINAGGFVTKKF